VTPGEPQMASLEMSLPIENSPPRIQTIPSGAFVFSGDAGDSAAFDAMVSTPKMAAQTQHPFLPR